MYILKQTINGKEKPQKCYRKLGNALNAFWKIFNENKLENLDNLSIFSKICNYYLIKVENGKLI